MPGQDAFYRDDFDKSEWGLAKARAGCELSRLRVRNARCRPRRRSKTISAGSGRLGIDMLASHGDLEVIDGIQKNRIKCNWKLAVDNLYDWYHVKVSHGSALRVGFVARRRRWRR